ncbi:MAG: DUF1836 domain-containing protein [Eggerthellaceae bacterium]|jgi:hypothetical protein|nr:DUF1836 domain-containing protein [Eggerthellaceae bacterium]MCH4221091.1 DUF1836 domain-containing protein [Eggerthellaceae bacterium]
MSHKQSEITPLNLDEFTSYVQTMRLPRFEDIPRLELYMDQLLSIVDTAVEPLSATGDRPLTSSMVNNYVKQGVVPQPKSKRYSRYHVAYLIVVCLLKQVYSMTEITQLVNDQISSIAVDVAYDFFCTAFEESMRTLFCGKTATDTLGGMKLHCNQRPAFALQLEGDELLTEQRRLAIAVATSIACKFYAERHLIEGVSDASVEKQND